MSRPSKITVVEALRGLAVTAVCFAHFGKPAGTGGTLPEMFAAMEVYFRFAVHVFFLISGFVITYSMHMGKYELNDYFTFISKRFLRLHPPYLAALAISLAIAAISYHYRHLHNPETPLSIVKSLFFLHAPSANPVFWTLKIEAQFYLFIGLFFPVLNKFPKATLLVSLPLFLFLSQYLGPACLDMLKWMPFFLTGIIGFRIYIQDTDSHLEYFLLGILIVFSFLFYGTGEALTAAATLFLMLGYRKPVHSALTYLGEISYSLYLIHFPVGIKFINLLQRYTAPGLNWLLFIGASLLSFCCALLFWRYIEKPFAKLSKKVKYVRAK